MAKKTFAAARLVKAKRWYIEWVEESPSGPQRHRKEFDLNQIPDLTIREHVGLRLAEYLHHFLRETPDIPVQVQATPGPTLADAVKAAVAAKLKSPRKNTHRGYKSISKKFLSWAEGAGLSDKPIREFGRRHARAFFSWLTGSREYRNVTLNNYSNHCQALWTEIIKDEWITENPWTCIESFRKQKKLRRPFTDQERRTVATEIEKTDYWMFRCVLLQFFCYVRPVELTRLRMRDFDLSRGVVTVQEGDAKSWKAVPKTIPKSIMHYFLDGKFEKYPASYYMLGLHEDRKGMAYITPGTKQVDDDRMYRRHLKVLNRLKKRGALTDLTGLSWYSWKDTGISLHARRTSPVATKDQAGHANLSMTSLYDSAPEINELYRNLENDLF